MRAASRPCGRLSAADRVYGLSRVWSEAAYNFAFWSELPELDWDGAYRRLLPRMAEPLPALDWYLLLSRFLSLLDDGHTYLDLPAALLARAPLLPLRLRQIGGRHYVAAAAAGCPIPPGSEVQALDGMPFGPWLEKQVLPWCWHARPDAAFAGLYMLSRLPHGAARNAYSLIPLLRRGRTLHLTTDAGTFAVRPAPGPLRWRPAPPRPPEPLETRLRSPGLTAALTTDGIAVLTLPTFLDDAMPAAFYRLLPSLRDCRGFVIDLRGNGGGHSDNADAFAQAFRSGPFPIAQVRHPVHIGACKAFGAGLPPGALDPRDPRQKQILDVCRHTLFEEELETVSRPDCPLTLTRPAVVLTDAGTASSSENLLLALEGRAAVVGTPSAGSTGNPLPVPLPGGGAARICTRRYAHADGRPFHNLGIRPDIAAGPEPDDLRSGFDRVLACGLAALRQRL